MAPRQIGVDPQVMRQEWADARAGAGRRRIGADGPSPIGGGDFDKGGKPASGG